MGSAKKVMQRIIVLGQIHCLYESLVARAESRKILTCDRSIMSPFIEYKNSLLYKVSGTYCSHSF